MNAPFEIIQDWAGLKTSPVYGDKLYSRFGLLRRPEGQKKSVLCSACMVVFLSPFIGRAWQDAQLHDCPHEREFRDTTGRQIPSWVFDLSVKKKMELARQVNLREYSVELGVQLQDVVIEPIGYQGYIPQPAGVRGHYITNTNTISPLVAPTEITPTIPDIDVASLGRIVADLANENTKLRERINQLEEEVKTQPIFASNGKGNSRGILERLGLR